jgi:hypothetical protein
VALLLSPLTVTVALIECAEWGGWPASWAMATRCVERRRGEPEGEVKPRPKEQGTTGNRLTEAAGCGVCRCADRTEEGRVRRRGGRGYERGAARSEERGVKQRRRWRRTNEKYFHLQVDVHLSTLWLDVAIFGGFQ